MNSEQRMVTEFHRKFTNQVHDRPCIIDNMAIHRRFRLMTEELLELRNAMFKRDFVEIADGIADLLYVVYGTAVEYGIDMEPIFAEVHRSNMTKVDGHLNDFGKWIKPESYSPPDLEPIIKDQIGD